MSKMTQHNNPILSFFFYPDVLLALLLPPFLFLYFKLVLTLQVQMLIIAFLPELEKLLSPLCLLYNIQIIESNPVYKSLKGITLQLSKIMKGKKKKERKKEKENKLHPLT
ncbi:hypothetical protein ACJX0J_015634 [Zea mays]